MTHGLHHRNMLIDDVPDCIAACCDNPQCVAWTVSRPEPNPTWNCALNTTCCWLKSSSTQARVNRTYTTSGVISHWQFSVDLDIYADNSVIEVRSMCMLSLFKRFGDHAATVATCMCSAYLPRAYLSLQSQRQRSNFSNTVTFV